MEQLRCTSCGSASIIEEGALYVCESCGLKHTHNTIERMVVEIEGAVRIDHSEELTNLHTLARRARDSKDTASAKEYYERILLIAPNSWEAAFYSLIYRSVNCTIAELPQSSDKVLQGLPAVITLVKDTVGDRAEQKRVLTEMVQQLAWLIDVYSGNAQESLKSNVEAKRKVLLTAGNIAYKFVLELRKLSPEEREFIDLEIFCIKQGLRLHSMRINSIPADNNADERRIFMDWANTVRKFDRNYVIPSIPQKTAAEAAAAAAAGRAERQMAEKRATEARQVEAVAKTQAALARNVEERAQKTVEKAQQKEADLKKIKKNERIENLINWGILIALIVLIVLAFRYHWFGKLFRLMWRFFLWVGEVVVKGSFKLIGWALDGLFGT